MPTRLLCYCPVSAMAVRMHRYWTAAVRQGILADIEMRECFARQENNRAVVSLASCHYAIKYCLKHAQQINALSTAIGRSWSRRHNCTKIMKFLSICSSVSLKPSIVQGCFIVLGKPWSAQTGIVGVPTRTACFWFILMHPSVVSVARNATGATPPALARKRITARCVSAELPQ